MAAILDYFDLSALWLHRQGDLPEAGAWVGFRIPHEHAEEHYPLRSHDE
jgi:hypothetical protein